jgi:hypothetical protein
MDRPQEARDFSVPASAMARSGPPMASLGHPFISPAAFKALVITATRGFASSRPILGAARAPLEAAIAQVEARAALRPASAHASLPLAYWLFVNLPFAP